MAGPQVIPAQPALSASARVVAAPFQFVLREGDILFLSVANSASGVQVAVQGRRYDEFGEIKPIDRRFTPSTDRTVTGVAIDLGRGAILNLRIFVTAGSPKLGQTYCLLGVQQGTGAAAVGLGAVLAGYVTASQGLGWPGSPIEDSLAGSGVVRSFEGSIPAAGSSILETVPTGARWELLSVAVDLTTSAAAANRVGILVTARAFGVLTASWQTLAVPATTFGTFAWAAALHPAGGATIGATPTGTAGLPAPCYMMAADQLQISAQNLQVGDQFSAPRITVREWLEV